MRRGKTPQLLKSEVALVVCGVCFTVIITELEKIEDKMKKTEK